MRFVKIAEAGIQRQQLSQRRDFLRFRPIRLGKNRPMNQPTPPVRTDEMSDKATTKLVIPSEDILKGSREVLIRHADVIYRLCLTKNGKLILQK